MKDEVNICLIYCVHKKNVHKFTLQVTTVEMLDRYDNYFTGVISELAFTFVHAQAILISAVEILLLSAEHNLITCKISWVGDGCFSTAAEDTSISMTFGRLLHHSMSVMPIPLLYMYF